MKLFESILNALKNSDGLSLARWPDLYSAKTPVPDRRRHVAPRLLQSSFSLRPVHQSKQRCSCWSARECAWFVQFLSHAQYMEASDLLLPALSDTCCSLRAVRFLSFAVRLPLHSPTAELLHPQNAPTLPATRRGERHARAEAARQKIFLPATGPAKGVQYQYAYARAFPLLLPHRPALACLHCSGADQPKLRLFPA